MFSDVWRWLPLSSTIAMASPTNLLMRAAKSEELLKTCGHFRHRFLAAKVGLSPTVTTVTTVGKFWAWICLIQGGLGVVTRPLPLPSPTWECLLGCFGMFRLKCCGPFRKELTAGGTGISFKIDGLPGWQSRCSKLIWTFLCSFIHGLNSKLTRSYTICLLMFASWFSLWGALGLRQSVFWMFVVCFLNRSGTRSYSWCVSCPLLLLAYIRHTSTAKLGTHWIQWIAWIHACRLLWS